MKNLFAWESRKNRKIAYKTLGGMDIAYAEHIET